MLKVKMTHFILPTYNGEETVKCLQMTDSYILGIASLITNDGYRIVFLSVEKVDHT